MVLGLPLENFGVPQNPGACAVYAQANVGDCSRGCGRFEERGHQAGEQMLLSFADCIRSKLSLSETII
jgi:hypothetical protein